MIQLIGAFIYRWRGMDNPHPVPELIFCFPFAALAAWEWYSHGWEAALMAFIVVGGLMTLVCVTGHGRFHNITEPLTGMPEKLEKVTLWLYPHVSTTVYKIICMSLKGFLMMLPFAVATLNPLPLLAGACMGLAYYLSYKTNAGSMGGELLTGAILWGCLI